MLATFLSLLVCLVAFKSNHVLSAGLGEGRRMHHGGYEVETKSGRLKGKVVKSVNGEHFISFRGIPYAEPPIGELRFMDPQPAKKWDDEGDALEEGNKCPQIDRKTLELSGNEDCLFLNVYTPDLPSKGNLESMPVMVWIHGGYFSYGSGDSAEHGPDFLVYEGVVVVTMNYRLGPLGFLYMPGGVPGNAGMKDQVLALQWVQEHIAVFGGDPKKVTIFGYSAGAASVHLHTLSPLSAGLFHGAIAQSGSALMNVFTQSAPRETSQRLATAVKCPTKDPVATVKCLQEADVETLLKAGLTEAPTEQDKKRFTPFPFVPTVDAGPNAFLPEPVCDMMAKETTTTVPFIAGFNDGESQKLLEFLNVFNESIQQYLDKSWGDKIFQDTMPIDNTKQEEAVAEIRKFYLQGKPISNDTIQGYMNMLTDIFGHEIMLTLNHMKSTQTYLYYFTMDDILNSEKPTLPIKLAGASHGDEMGYLFHQQQLPMAAKDSKAHATRQTMVTLWTHFAKLGKPGLYNDLHNWSSYDVEGGKYLEIGLETQEKTALNADRMKFWNTFYEKFGTSPCSIPSKPSASRAMSSASRGLPSVSPTLSGALRGLPGASAALPGT